MIDEKGLDPLIADKIGSYVVLKGSTNLLDKLLQDPELSGNKRAKEGLDEIKLLFKYLEAYSVIPFVRFLPLTQSCPLEYLWNEK